MEITLRAVMKSRDFVSDLGLEKSLERMWVSLGLESLKSCLGLDDCKSRLRAEACRGGDERGDSPGHPRIVKLLVLAHTVWIWWKLARGGMKMYVKWAEWEMKHTAIIILSP